MTERIIKLIMLTEWSLSAKKSSRTVIQWYTEKKQLNSFYKKFSFYSQAQTVGSN